ncbi:CD166-like protein [Mya arenaria]|uniref:CD166-like protein n=1 Tax=Mya arenaria TaxID=6604 RepID=A0ABY7EC92_MYAAR|nr:CD166-like protein [Mya arenaria]
MYIPGSDGSVIISSSATSVPEGSSLTLNCTYTGNDLVRGIQWVNNGNNMGRKYDIAIEQSKPCSILRIPGLNQTLFNYTCFTLTVFNVTRNNQSDNFKCAAITGVTISSENSVIVNVTVPISTVELTSPTETYVTLNAGELKNFRCRTSGGLPKPTVEWYKTYGYNCNRNGIKITTNMSSLPSAKNGLIEVESSLHFNASSLDNTLWICCAASNVNSQWELSRSKQLEIRHPPPSPPVIDNFIAMSYFKMIENSTERLTCTSTGGNPLASLAWSCNNGIESYPNKSDGSVSRSISWTARRNQDPICTCTATHEAGPPQLVNMHINPPSIPKFKVNGIQVGTTISLINGSTETVECHSSGNPYPSANDFTWRKGKVVVSSNSNSSWIGGIKIQDGGSYKCSVTTTMTPSDTKQSPCPTGLIASLTTSSSVTIEWVSHFNGGFKQTFVILYKTIESSEYLVLTENELDKKTKNTKTISRLKDGSTYDIILFSRNAIGNCRQNTSIQIETDLLVDDPPPSYSTLIVGLAGGIPAVCVVVVVVAVVIVVVLRKRRSYKKRETRHVLAQGQKQQSLNAVDEDSDDIPNEVENPMYDGFECSAARQDPRDVLYTLPKKKGGDIYTENFNSDGLVYADTVFADQPKGQTLRGTHGGGDTTVYADVDLTKKAKTLPESDGEDGVKRETIQQ